MAQGRVTSSHENQFHQLSIYFKIESERMCFSPLPISLNSSPPLLYLTGYSSIIYLCPVAGGNQFCVKEAVPEEGGKGQMDGKGGEDH